MDKNIKLISIFGNNRDLKRNIHIITKNKIGYIIENIIYVLNLEENIINLYKKHIGYIYIFRYSNHLKLALTCDFNHYTGCYVSLWDIDEYKEKYNIKIKNIESYDFFNYTFNNKQIIHKNDISYKQCMISDINFVDALECLVILTNDKYKTISFWSLLNTQKPILCIYTHMNKIEKIFLWFNYDIYKNNIRDNKNIYDYLEYLTILTYSSKCLYMWYFSFYIELKINCFKPIYNNLIPLDKISTICSINTNKYFIGTNKGNIYLFDKYIAKKYYEISKSCIKLIFLLDNILICILKNGMIYRIKELDNKTKCNKSDINVLLNNYYKKKFQIEENIVPFKWINYSEYYLNFILIATNTHVILMNIYNDEFIILKEIFENDIYISTFIQSKNKYIIAMINFYKEDKSLIRMLNLDNTLYNCPLVVEGKVNCIISTHNNKKQKKKNYVEKTEENENEGNNNKFKCFCEDKYQMDLKNEKKKIIRKEKNNISNIFVFSINNKIVFYEELNSVLSSFYSISYSHNRYVTCFEFSKDNKYLFCGFNEGSIYIYTIFNSSCYNFYNDHNINKFKFIDMNNKYCIALYKIFRNSIETIDMIKLYDINNMKLIVSSNKKLYLYNLFENSIKNILNLSLNLNLSFFELFEDYINDDIKLANSFFKKLIEENIILNKKDILESNINIYLRDVLNDIQFRYKIIYLRKEKKDDTLIDNDNIFINVLDKNKINYKKEETYIKKKINDISETNLENYVNNNDCKDYQKEINNNKVSYYNLYIFNKVIFFMKNNFEEIRKVVEQRNVYNKNDTNNISNPNSSSNILSNKNGNDRIINYHTTTDNNIIDFMSENACINNLMNTLIFKKDIFYTELNLDGNLMLCSFKDVVFVYLIKDDSQFYSKRECNYSKFLGNIIDVNLLENKICPFNYDDFPIIICENKFLNDYGENYFYNSYQKKNIKTNIKTNNENPIIFKNILHNDDYTKHIIIKNDADIQNKIRDAKDKENLDGNNSDLLEKVEEKYHNVIFMYNDYLSFEKCSNKYISENKYNHKNSALNSNKMKNILSPQYKFSSYLNTNSTRMLKVPYAIDYKEEQKKITNKKPNEVSRSIYLENGINSVNENTNNKNTFYYKIIHSNYFYEVFIYVKGGNIDRIEKTKRNSLKFISTQMEEENILEINIPSTIRVYYEQILIQMNSLHNICYLSIPILEKKE
ncbi:hypothetical protein PGAL8A_00380300 [Plasmodium gallinaceum]|uniref:Uncharacterized protein n=1 Tax=Plasmodium gallinaceum TaxID=5849 RepID=A0A1J1GSS2_PLAGA|nr:hypothetical protein PGAL8A_00380300 [Plasmodium gallinaceum]CRG94099.1 hypothetical protein PGAL8A_00380300 [Plasmodium gallinaceum]